MKMLKNEHEVDASVTSRTPIPSPPSTKKAVAPRYAAHPPAPPVQVHPDHHAEDGAVAVAVAEHADGAEPVDEEAVLPKKRYKNRGFPSIVPKCVVNVDTRWDANANVPRHDDDPPNDDGV